ncbi:MAG: ATP-binding cassette domain-containing protein [Actinomycetota bacterium]
MTEGLRARVRVQRGDFLLDADLVVGAGETVALLGPNGAGKSTAIDAIAGLAPLDAGRVELDGRVLDDAEAGVFVPPERRGIGVMFQRYLLFEHLHALDNVAFGLRRAGLGRSAARAEAARWLDRFGLTTVAEQRPGQLSGGQAQRVALARALAVEPRLLLLDEPLAALDVTSRARSRRLLADDLDGQACPRVLITHDPLEAVLLGDRIVVLEDGRVTQVGTADDLRRRPSTPYVADLVGTNLLRASISGGRVRLLDERLELIAADVRTEGPVLVTIAPSAVSLHREEPHGSPRNAWETVVTGVEVRPETVRLSLAEPRGLVVEVTAESVEVLGLRPGSAVWASVKATEISVNRS